MPGGPARYVIVTRPFEDAEATAAALARLAWYPFIEPLLSVEFLDIDPPPAANCVVFTSAHAVRGLMSRHAVPAHTPVYAVGTHTAHEAELFGLANIRISAGNGTALIRDIETDRPGSVLYVRGESVAVPLAETLRQAGIQVYERIVYRTNPARAVSEACLTLLRENEVAAILLMSARTASVWRDLAQAHACTDHLKNVCALCMSQSVADAARALPWAGIHIAEKPDQASLLALLGRADE